MFVKPIQMLQTFDHSMSPLNYKNIAVNTLFAIV